LICLLATPLFSTETTEREMTERLQLLTVREWEAGALRVAEEFGCHQTTWQLREESVEQVIAVYAHGHVQGDCLILFPERGARGYFFGYAGQFEGRVTNDIPSRWPGVPVYYLRDTCTPLMIQAAKRRSEGGPNLLGGERVKRSQ
jgi:hypothetical protein